MLSENEFIKKFQSAKSHFERVQICIFEQRYQIWMRGDKPNLNGNEFVNPILNLPINHPCIYRQRKTGGLGLRFVIEFRYSVAIFGAIKKIYFKGYFTHDWTLKLEVQSLRDNNEV